MVRVGALKDQIEADYNKPDPAGLTPKQQVRQIAKNRFRAGESAI